MEKPVEEIKPPTAEELAKMAEISRQGQEEADRVAAEKEVPTSRPLSQGSGALLYMCSAYPTMHAEQTLTLTKQKEGTMSGWLALGSEGCCNPGEGACTATPRVDRFVAASQVIPF